MGEAAFDDDFLKELRNDFFVEAEEKLDECESQVLDFERSQDSDILDAIKRELHCLKGSSKATGLSVFSEMVHVMENYCESADTLNVENFLSWLDQLKESIESYRNDEDDEADEKLKATLSGM